MKVLVVLSGSIRLPQNSLAAITKWRANHDVDVAIHTWKSVSGIHSGHWHVKTATEPTREILDGYKPRQEIIEDWSVVHRTFREQADRIQESLGFRIDNISLLSMYYSLYRSYSLMRSVIAEYDMVVRLRFDGIVRDDIFTFRNDGWTIPEGSDFGGINDRLGWLAVNRNDIVKTMCCADAYLGLYPNIEKFLKQGCAYNPEIILAASLQENHVPVSRVPFDYSILGF